MRYYFLGFFSAMLMIPLVYLQAKITAKNELIAEAERAEAIRECTRTGMNFDACRYLVGKVKPAEQEASHE